MAKTNEVISLVPTTAGLKVVFWGTIRCDIVGVGEVEEAQNIIQDHILSVYNNLQRIKQN